MADDTLDGLGVLITRPRQQAGELVAAISARGGNPVPFPSLEIVPRERAVIETDERALHVPDITILISRNAVIYGLDFAAGRLAAIGPTTAAEIESAGGTVDICPTEGFDSEHLLAHASFRDIAGKTVRIVRGNGGREKLARELRARGATVEYLETYERRLPDYAPGQVDDMERRWRAGEIGAVVIMSVESLRNLQSLLSDSGAELLLKTLLVTPAARVLKESLEQDPDRPAILAAGPQADDIVNAIATTVRKSSASHP